MIYKKRKGMKVEIWDAEQKNKLGIGTYIDSKRVKAWGCSFWTPRFKLGRRFIHGFECWWIPVKYAFTTSGASGER